MKILNLLRVGGIGGIEVLSRNIAYSNKDENIFCFTYQGGVVCDEMKESGALVYELDGGAGFKIATLRKILKICKEERVDIINIHHMDVYLHIYFLILRKCYNKAKFIITLHSCAAHRGENKKIGIKTKLRWRIFDRALKRSDMLIAVSDAVKQSYIKWLSISKEKIEVVYNGIQENALTVNSNNLSNMTLLYIGRISPEKGLQVLIKVLSQLNDKEKIRLIIVGDGYYLPYLKHITMSYHMEKIVEFKESNRQLEDYYSEANVFIYPSLCEEAFGISIIEAMSYGLPCIGTMQGGIPEIIINGQNGLLIEEMTLICYLNTLEKMRDIIKSSEYKEMQLKAIDTAKKFTIGNTIESLRKCYEKVLED